jgi:putative membrane protein
MPADKPYRSATNEVVAEATESELDTALELSFTRTELASDRTLLAWIRTALTLMAAGVAYDKGFRLLHDERLAEGTAWVRSANFAGVLVTAASTVLLAMATVRHLMIARSLAGARQRGMGGAIPTLLAAGLVILLGCAVIVFLLATG